MNQATQSTPTAPSPAHGPIVDDILENTERSYELLEKQAKRALRSRFFAEAITDDDQAVTIVMIGRELGIPPMTALREIHLIPTKDGRFKPAISAHLKHALAMRKVPGFVINVLQSDERAAVITAYRPGMEKPARFEWTTEDSRRAGLLQPSRSGQPSNHVKYPRQMYLARVKAIAVDTVCPEATIGFPSVEEVRDEQYIERLAEMGTLPAVGSSSDRDPLAKPAPLDPSTIRMRTFEELAAMLDDCRDTAELESFRDRTKPDRLALPKEQRETLATTWTKRYGELGGKLGRAAAAKQNAEQAAAAPPATPEQHGEEPATAQPTEEPAKDAAAKRTRRSPEEIKAAQETAEKELLADLEACHTRDEIVAWEETEGFKARWGELSPAGKSRMRKAITSREKELEAPAATSSGEREPGSDG